MYQEADLSDRVGKLVCDAQPDPPRVVNDHNENESLNNKDAEDGANKKEKDSKLSDDDLASESTSETFETDGAEFFEQKRNNQSQIPLGNIVFKCNFYNSTGNSIGFQTMNTYMNQGSKFNKATPNASTKEMSLNARILSKSQEEISTKDMLLIKNHVVNYKKLARRLSFSKAEVIEIVKLNEHKGQSEIVYKLLYKWWEKYTKKATVGLLIGMLWSANEFQCVEIYASEKNKLDDA